MQLDKHEGLQVRAGPNQSQINQARTELWLFSQKYIEAFVLRYFKVGISISVQSQYSIHVNMWQSPTQHTVCCVTCLPYII